MYREDYYVNQGTIKPTNAIYQSYYTTMSQTDNERSVSPVDIILSKNRSGETGSIILFFFKAVSSFETPDNETLLILKIYNGPIVARKVAINEVLHPCERFER